MVIGAVGGNIGACREFVGDDFDVFRRYSVFRQPFEVSLVIMADSGADDGLFTHQRERIGNIARRAAVFFLHAIHLKTNVEHVNFIGQDVIGEVSGKIHNPVIRQ